MRQSTFRLALVSVGLLALVRLFAVQTGYAQPVGILEVNRLNRKFDRAWEDAQVELEYGVAYRKNSLLHLFNAIKLKYIAIATAESNNVKRDFYPDELRLFRNSRAAAYYAVTDLYVDLDKMAADTHHRSDNLQMSLKRLMDRLELLMYSELEETDK